MSVDTVFVAYGSDDVLPAALALAGRLGGRSVVVDHGDGGCARLAAGSGAIAVHDPSNPGFGAGQNRGIWFTDSEFVLLCNPDAEIVPDAVLAGAELLRERPDVAAVQGVIRNRATGRPERSAGVELGPVHLLGRAMGARALLRLRVIAGLARRSSRLADHADRVPSGPVEVEHLAATAVLVRRSAFEEVGGFDESYFLYGEDLDFCRQLRTAGWKLIAVPEAWAVHAGGGSATSTWSREIEWWRGTMRFAARHWNGLAWATAVVAAGLRWMLLALRHPSHVQVTYERMVRDARRHRARDRASVTPGGGPPRRRTLERIGMRRTPLGPGEVAAADSADR